MKTKITNAIIVKDFDSEPFLMKIEFNMLAK